MNTNNPANGEFIKTIDLGKIDYGENVITGLIFHKEMLYVSDCKGVHIYNTKTYEKIKSLELSGTMKIENGKLFFYDSSVDKLMIYNIENLANPFLVGSLEDKNMRDLNVVGNYVFLSDRRTPISGMKGIDIIDISDCSNPKLIKNIPRIERVFDMKIKDKYLFWSKEPLGIFVSDVSEINSFKSLPRDFFVGFTLSESIFIDKDYLYIASDKKTQSEILGVKITGGVYIVDISDVEKPILLGNINIQSEKMFLKNGYAYIANDYGGDDEKTYKENLGLYIVNIKDKTKPILEKHIADRSFSDITGWEVEY